MPLCLGKKEKTDVSCNELYVIGVGFWVICFHVFFDSLMVRLGIMCHLFEVSEANPNDKKDMDNLDHVDLLFSV